MVPMMTRAEAQRLADQCYNDRASILEGIPQGDVDAKRAYLAGYRAGVIEILNVLALHGAIEPWESTGQIEAAFGVSSAIHSSSRR